MPTPKKYATDEERRAARAAQKLESARRLGYKHQNEYARKMNYKHQRAYDQKTGRRPAYDHSTEDDETNTSTAH